MEDAKKKYVRWSFTNNTTTDIEPVLHDKMQCLVYQLEKGEENGKIHWQGAFIVKNRNGVQKKTAKKMLLGDPHLEPMKGTWEQNVKYCSKEETRVKAGKILGCPPAYGNELKAKKVSKLKTFVDGICKEGKSKRQVMIEDPDTYIRNHNGIERYLDVVYKPTINKKYNLDDFCTEPLDFTKSMVYVIKGPSGIGKTQFALAHFDNPLFVSHIDDLKKFDGHDGIVIDDMDFSNRYDREFQIHLIDTEHERSLHARYCNARRPANIPMIFTTNTRVFMYDPAIERRHKEIEYKFSLFSDKNYVFEESQ